MSAPGGGIPGLVVRLASLLVPAGEREAWRREWLAELDALARARAGGRGADEEGDLPMPIGFALGALPHAMWTTTRRWTMDSMIQDLRFAARTLRRAPGFAAVAAVTLALGIGANATIFALMNGLVLQDPPGVDDPGRLIQVARSYDDAPRWDNWSWPAYEVISESPALAGVAGFSGRSAVLGSGAEASLEPMLYVTGSYFPVLGVDPAAGRLFGPGDDRTPGGHPVVVLGHGLWTSRWGADPGVVGTNVRIGGEPYEVVGVAPRDFRGTRVLGAVPSLFVPTAQRPGFQGMLPFDQWGWSWLEVIARTAPGVDPAAAQAAMDAVTARLRAADQANEDIRVLTAAGVGLSPDEKAEADRIGVLLAGIALLVLLLTCANVANLFVARATTRASEMGVRLALGAGTGRLVRQLGTEAVVLGLGAAALSIPLVLAASRALPGLLPYAVTVDFTPDGRVFLVLAALGVVSGLLFGAVPAIAVARRDVTRTLREGGATSVSGSSRGRDALVVAQIAISLALVAATTLLGRSVLNASSADPGFDPRDLVVASVDTGPTGRYDRAAALVFQERLLAAARELPGVRSATVASQAPFFGGHTRAGTWPEGRPPNDEPPLEAELAFVGEDYLSTMGVSLLEGRALGSSAVEPEPVALVNESLARRFWPGESAVGKRLGGGEDGPIRVVGVVNDVQNRSLRSPAAPTVYRPLGDAFGQRAVLLLRVEGDPAAYPSRIRRMVADLDPGVPVGAVGELHAHMADTLGATRSLGLLAALFAGLALALSAIGVYGLTAYGVSRRRRELGVRLALGSGPGRIVRLVLRRAARLAALGAATGGILALLLGRALDGVLFGVESAGLGAPAGAAAVLVLVSLAAAWIPARRAGRVDATVSLREGA